MSLINKVLRDLEARERDERAASSRPVLADLRAAAEPPARFALAKWLLLAGVIAMMGLVVVWYMGGGHGEAAPPAVAKPPVAPSVAARPSPHAVAPPPRAKTPRPAASARPLPKPAHAAVFVSSARPAVLPHRAAHRTRRAPAAISRQRKPLTPAEQATAAYRRAVQALQAGNAGQARAALHAALRARPASLRSALLLATLDIQGAHLHAARELLRTALRAHPRALPVFMLLAQIDLRRGRPGDAARTLGRAEAYGAARRSYWALLAASRLRAGDQAGALSAYHSGLGRFPDDGPLWVGAGLAESRLGHASRARQAWRRALHCPLTPVLARFVQDELQGDGASQKR